MKPIAEMLMEYHNTDFYGFHMPGHKRNVESFGNDLPYAMDITEIEGFDDLHHPEDILLEAQKRAAKAFGAEESFYLINGSTVGNLSAILSITQPGDKIVVARNNHKSVYNAVFLNRLKPIFIYPKFHEETGINGEISKNDLEKILVENTDVKGVVIVSPTYDGVVSDVKGIAEVAHAYGIPLIVDEAHGAHFGFHEYFPKNANELGADIVVHSVHKTLPSLTQTGLLHVNGSIVDRKVLKRYLKMLQSSSPSYILMASIDSCVHILESRGTQLFHKYVVLLSETREKLSQLEKLQIIKTEHFDKSKIIISTRKSTLSSKILYNILLEKYSLQMEMCGADYVTAMTSIGDTAEGLQRLVEALIEIDKEYEFTENNVNQLKARALPKLEMAQEETEGSEWFYYLYPPGIPLIVPGEMITPEIQLQMQELEDAGFLIQRG